MGTDHLPLNHPGQVTESLQGEEGQDSGGEGGFLESTHHLYRVVMKSKCADGYRVNTQYWPFL